MLSLELYRISAAVFILLSLTSIGSAQQVESGSFKFFVGKQQIGSERYRRERGDNGTLIVSGENELKAGGGLVKQTFKLKFDDRLEWRETAIEAEAAGTVQKAEVTVVGGKVKIRAATGDGTPVEQERPHTPGVIIWGSNIFTPVALLAQKYDAQRGGSQLLGAMLPNYPIEVESKGKTEVEVAGKKRTVTKYVALIAKTQENIFWVDEGGALVKLELPAQNFMVIRDGAEPLVAALDALEKPKSVAHALPPGVRTEEVKFQGEGLTLAGTLFLPKLEAGKRAPAMLIIAGSGPTPRDGVALGKVVHYTYRDIAEHLAARGFAVLSYDKRCVGASECRQQSSLDDFVSDAQKALAFLRGRAEVDPARVAVFGHSEGGYIAATLGSYDEKLAAVVLASTAGRTLGKLLREQVQNRMTEAGRPEAEIKAYLGKLDRVLSAIQNGRHDFTAEQIDPNDTLLVGLTKNPEFVMSLLINDPLQIVAAVHAPILVLQGEKDIQVSVRDAQYIEEALKRTNHPDFTLRLLPDVDHLLKTNKGAATLQSYSDASRPVDPGMLTMLTEWLQKKLR